MLDLAWISPLVSAGAFVLILFFGKRMRFRGSEVGIAAMAVSTVLAIAMAVEWIRGDRAPVIKQLDWFSFGSARIQAGTYVDGLSVMMLLVVGIISLLVQIYSTHYMKAV